MKRNLRLIGCGLLAAAVVWLTGCASSNHPMTEMIRVQRELVEQLADVLHGVDDASNLEAATGRLERISARSQYRMEQISRNMNAEAIPRNHAQLQRLQSEMMREARRLEPVMKRIQADMERLAKEDWAAPLLEAAEKCSLQAELTS